VVSDFIRWECCSRWSACREDRLCTLR